MFTLPDDISAQYELALKKRAIAATRHSVFRKWLRHYLDFFIKYQPPDSKLERVRLFIEKLRKKKQTPEQQQQAAHAVSLYFEGQKGNMTPIVTDSALVSAAPPSVLRRASRYSEVVSLIL